MLKFTSVIVGLLAATAIAQPSFAMNAPTTSTPVITHADSNLHAQLVINVGGQRREAEYRRERAREQARREARHHRYSERDRGEHWRHDQYHR